MDLNGWIALIGPVVTYAIGQWFKKNAWVKNHAPVAVTLLSALVGFIQAAITALPANAQGIDTTSVATQTVHAHTFIGSALGFMLNNMGFSALLHGWLNKYILEKLAKV